MAHGLNVDYTAVLVAKDELSPLLWIWDVAKDACPDGRQVSDRFHAVEHLTDDALYPNEGDIHKVKPLISNAFCCTWKQFFARFMQVKTPFDRDSTASQPTRI